MTELRQRVIEEMRLRGLAEGTQQVYVEAVKHLAAHYSRSPDQLTEEEVRDFILHLTETRKLVKSTVRVHLFALKFLYRMTLQRDWRLLSLACMKKSTRLPVILSREEASHLLSLIRRPAARMSCVMMYSCGLRISEATRLKPSDIANSWIISIDNGRVVFRYRKVGETTSRTMSLDVHEFIRRFLQHVLPTTPSRVTGMAIGEFHTQVARMWYKALRRRSQRTCIT